MLISTMKRWMLLMCLLSVVYANPMKPGSKQEEAATAVAEAANGFTQMCPPEVDRLDQQVACVPGTWTVYEAMFNIDEALIGEIKLMPVETRWMFLGDTSRFRRSFQLEDGALEVLISTEKYPIAYVFFLP